MIDLFYHLLLKWDLANVRWNSCISGVGSSASSQLQFLIRQTPDFRWFSNSQHEMNNTWWRAAATVWPSRPSQSYTPHRTPLRWPLWNIGSRAHIFRSHRAFGPTASRFSRHLGFEASMSRIPRNSWQIRCWRAWSLSSRAHLWQSIYRSRHSALWALSLGGVLWSSGCWLVITVLQIRTSSVSFMSSWVHRLTCLHKLTSFHKLTPETG